MSYRTFLATTLRRQDNINIASLYSENWGVEEKHIGKLILQQLSVWFGLPIITAIIVAAVVIAYFIQTISAEISAYIGFSTLMLQIGATMGILAIFIDLLLHKYMDYFLGVLLIHSECNL